MDKLGTIYNKLFQEIVSYRDHSKLNKFLNVPANGHADRIFVRNRKLDVVNLLMFLITPRAESMAVEAMEFFSAKGEVGVTKSAISQRRKLISPDIFLSLNEYLLQLYYSSPLPKRWKGKTMLAVDGTVISLPCKKGYENVFGQQNFRSEKSRPAARLVFVVDAINHVIVSVAIGKYTDDESTLAWQAISGLPHYLLENSILLFDRLYPSAWMFTMLHNNDLQYVMRCRRFFNPNIDKFFDSKRTSMDTDIQPSNTSWSQKTSARYDRMGIHEDDYRPIYLHLTKSILPSGETEVIASKVHDIHISASQAYNIYSKRWGVEVVIDEEKNEEQLEIFSGYSNTCIYQDIYAKVLSHNLCQIPANKVNDHLHSRFVRSRKKLSGKVPERKVNLNIAIFVFRSTWMSLCQKFHLNTVIKWLHDMMKSLADNTVLIIPGRHNPRVFGAYKINGKYITYVNYRRVI